MSGVRLSRRYREEDGGRFSFTLQITHRWFEGSSAPGGLLCGCSRVIAGRRYNRLLLCPAASNIRACVRQSSMGERIFGSEDVPEPMPGLDEVKLRVQYNGICGSDLHEYYDGPITTRRDPHPLTGVKNPVILRP